MNNRLLLVMLPEAQIAALMRDAGNPATSDVSIDVSAMHVKSASVDAPFTLSERHRRMFLEGLDVIGLSLTYRDQIEDFAKRHWTQHAWMKDVARTARDRLTWNQVKAADKVAGTQGAAAADC